MPPGHISPASAARKHLLTPNATSSAVDPAKTVSIGEGSSHRSSRVGETAGECAAVCCCCPCAMMHLLILAVYRIPTALFRRKKRKKILLRNKKKKTKKIGSTEEKEIHWRTSPGADKEKEKEKESNDVVVADWDNEMWGRFYGGGFWRSRSQRTHDDEY